MKVEFNVDDDENLLAVLKTARAILRQDAKVAGDSIFTDEDSKQSAVDLKAAAKAITKVLPYYTVPQ